MGDEKQDEWPEIIPDKFYCAQLTAYVSEDPPVGCGGAISGPTQCCWDGASVDWWIKNNNECRDFFHELCPLIFPTAQRLTGLKGPYDTGAECAAAC